MASYQSRYQPRRQTTVAGKIRSVDTYDRFYDIAWEALQRGSFPHLTLPAGRLLVRVLAGAFDIEAARTIPPGSSMKTDVRYSGRRLDGRPGQGALYVGTVAGVLREHAHYSLLTQPASPLQEKAPALWLPGAADQTRAYIQGQKSGSPPLGGERFHLFRLARTLRFADLRATSLAPLMHQLRASGEGARRYGIVEWSPVEFQISAPGASQDYSAARGMADAVFDLGPTTGDAGVCAFSSRSDFDSGLVAESHGDPTGGLVFAIFGADATKVAALEPAAPAPAPAPNASFGTFQDLCAAIA